MSVAQRKRSYLKRPQINFCDRTAKPRSEVSYVRLAESVSWASLGYKPNRSPSFVSAPAPTHLNNMPLSVQLVLTGYMRRHLQHFVITFHLLDRFLGFGTGSSSLVILTRVLIHSRSSILSPIRKLNFAPLKQGASTTSLINYLPQSVGFTKSLLSQIRANNIPSEYIEYPPNIGFPSINPALSICSTT